MEFMTQGKNHQYIYSHKKKKKKKRTFGYGKKVKEMKNIEEIYKKNKKDFLQICSLI